MVAYLDNNIIIDIEDRKIQIPQDKSIIYPFSYVHIEELLEAGDKLEMLKQKRLDTLTKLSNHNYLINYNSKLQIVKRSPLMAFNDFYNNPIALLVKEGKKYACNIMPDGDVLINIMGINKNVINNYKHQELLDKYGKHIITFVEFTGNSLLEKFQSFFTYLNQIGYYKEKSKLSPYLNISLDASHAFYASYCDYFVTNDKRAMYKANFIYTYYGIKTKAVSFEEFIKLI